jgi:glutathione S-transferase
LKLYTGAASPFAARARLAVYAYNLPVEMTDPPEGGLKGEAYLAINPLGRLPTLVLEDGVAIPESDTIVEYLADRFPDCGLRPATPAARAQARLLARVADLYVNQPGEPLRMLLESGAPDSPVARSCFVAIEEGLACLEVLIGGGPFAVGDTLTTADCALLSALFLTDVRDQLFRREPSLLRRPRLLAYWNGLRQQEPVAKVIEEMRRGLRSMFDIEVVLTAWERRQ